MPFHLLFPCSLLIPHEHNISLMNYCVCVIETIPFSKHVDRNLSLFAHKISPFLKHHEPHKFCLVLNAPHDNPDSNSTLSKNLILFKSFFLFVFVFVFFLFHTHAPHDVPYRCRSHARVSKTAPQKARTHLCVC